MLRVNNVNISILHSHGDLQKKLAQILGVKEREILSFRIRRQSVDARKKQDIMYSYQVDVQVQEEGRLLKKHGKNPHITKAEEPDYRIVCTGERPLSHRPVVLGFGPAGIFAALSLAMAGFRPLVIERGEDVDARSRSVEAFWTTGILNRESNVSFGEGGAGTFSDGKLNTLVKDSSGRNTFVLETLVRHGADEEILYHHKPHVGTDRLKGIVKSIRREIIALGGELRFCTCMKDIAVEDGRLQGIYLADGSFVPAEILILANGHSARDTFRFLHEKGVAMEAKSFAVGLRMIHSQERIDRAQYGDLFYRQLSPAPYKLSHTTASGRGVYSFCMCPGGYVVDASTTEGEMAVNGMSYHDRDSGSANAAIIVTVGKEDFYRECGREDALAGLAFQEKLEGQAYRCGQGRIPVQLYGDFKEGRISAGFGEVVPRIKGRYCFADLHEALPSYIAEALKEAIPVFDKKIEGFADKDAILLGVESRTSSPVRIPRDEQMQANIRGIFPCGEGAGYAGGITSAAMDGLKVAECINKSYKC